MIFFVQIEHHNWEQYQKQYKFLNGENKDRQMFLPGKSVFHFHDPNPCLNMMVLLFQMLWREDQIEFNSKGTTTHDLHYWYKEHKTLQNIRYKNSETFH